MASLQTWRGAEGVEVRYVEVWSFGRVRVVAGEPSGPAAGRPAAAAAFEADARQSGARVLWFGVEDPSAIGPDRPSVVIGADPVWATDRWPRILADKRSLRAQVARARNKGVVAEWWPAERAPELRPVLHGWLAGRGLPPLGFLADPFVLDSPGDRCFLVARQGDGVIGYLVLIPGEEAFVEWIIRDQTAPNGTSALLLDTAVRSLPPDSVFTLGLVPLSTHAPLSETTPRPLVRALLAWTRAHATRFYNFDGLERFKAKFVPDRWRPQHLVTDGREITVWTFHAVAAAFAAPQGPARFIGRALAKAVAEEARGGARWIRDRVRST